MFPFFEEEEEEKQKQGANTNLGGDKDGEAG